VTFLGPALAFIRFGQLGACALSTPTLEGINVRLEATTVDGRESWVTFDMETKTTEENGC